MDKERLAIIIPTFNRKEYLYKILDNFKNQDYKGLFKVIVVVDGATDGTIEMLKNNFSDVDVVIGNGNWWWTKSINEGLKYAINKKYIQFLLMNDDTFIEKYFLTKLMQQYYNVGGGVLGTISITSNKPHKIFYSGIRDVNWITAKFYKYHNFLQPYTKDIFGIHKTLFIPGRGMLFNSDIIDKIGFFQEKKFPQYYSDFAFSYKAFQAGFKVNISWDIPIYSYIELTAKGNRTNSNIGEFIKSFVKPMSANYIKTTFYFYKQFAKGSYFISFLMHYMRIIVSFLRLKIKN